MNISQKQAQQLFARAKKLQQEKNFPLAKKLYLQLLQVSPENPEVLHFLALLYFQTGETDIALQYLNRELILNPTSPIIYHNLGLIYKAKGDIDKAIDYYRHAFQLDPRYYLAPHKLANIYSELGNFDLAKKYYETTLAIKPDFAEGWQDFGFLFKNRREFNFARDCFEKSLQFNPNSPTAYCNLGNIYTERNQYESAIKYYQKALQLNANNDECYAKLARLYDEICHWDNYDYRQKKLVQLTQKEIAIQEMTSVAPFSALTYSWDATALAAIAGNQAFITARKLAAFKKSLAFQWQPSKKTKIRLGYLSCGFGKHPTAHLAYNLFASHNRDQFEIYAFSLSKDDQSHFYQHMANTCDHFISLEHASDVAAAKIIYENNIDILIELDGYIRGAHPGIAALRPAPVQISYLGFPGTTGADFFDYLIADKIVITPKVASTYQEKIIYLPHTYQINNNQQTIAAVALTRTQYGLPEQGFVYCCFNHPYKIEPTMFNVWMEILKAVPNSVLWLLSNSSLTVNNLKKEATKRNVDPQRLIFANYEEKSLHLARHRLADLFLDTLFYNAHTTASDALWAGLPMLTCPATNFPSRVSASLLTALGLPELIMPNLNTYRDTAIAYANNPALLEKIREKLQNNRLSYPLFDTKKFVKNLENAYSLVWQRHLSGKNPEHIYIEETADATNG